MIVGFKDIDDLDIRKKAIGIPVTHNTVTRTLWIPKSLIDNMKAFRRVKYLDVQDWFYDKAFEEKFL